MHYFESYIEARNWNDKLEYTVTSVITLNKFIETYSSTSDDFDKPFNELLIDYIMKFNDRFRDSMELTSIGGGIEVQEWVDDLDGYFERCFLPSMAFKFTKNIREIVSVPHIIVRCNNFTENYQECFKIMKVINKLFKLEFR